MPPLPDSLQPVLESTLKIRIKSFRPVAGGCINSGGEVITTTGRFFIKWNDAARYPAMFIKEAAGLELLLTHSTLRIPNVIAVLELSGVQVLVLEYISSAHRAVNFWQLLGEHLAALHRHTSASFGLNHHNYIGFLPQNNTPCKSWIEFFIQHRLEPQLTVAGTSGLTDTWFRKEFEMLYKKLPNLLPTEPPALLHGDLWSGNLMTDEKGEPCLIDPAIYYGHREAELAFTLLFGGFDKIFYETYHHAFPIQPGFEERVDIYNLYPLLVHVNLFGGGYLNPIRQIIRRLVR